MLELFFVGLFLNTVNDNARTPEGVYTTPISPGGIIASITTVFMPAFLKW